MNVIEEVENIKRSLVSIQNLLGDVNYETQTVARTVMQNSVPMTTDMNFGLYVGLVVDTIDIWKQNRVRFFHPKLHQPDVDVKELPWAHPISAMGGFDDSGLSWVPPAGSSVALVFESGHRSAPYYMGTVWHRDRGSLGQHIWGLENMMDEYIKIWEGHRKGYLVGPNDESQVLPPWNTESYNGFDLTSILDFADKPEVQKLITYPNIYGFKTPEKHMLKMVDGDPKCNRKWKRIELMSSTGNWLMMKDDHLHYAGQWSHPDCKPHYSNTQDLVPDDDVSCIDGVTEKPYPDLARSLGIDRGLVMTGTNVNDAADLSRSRIALNEQNAKAKDIQPDYAPPKETPVCGGKIIGGHPSTAHPKSKNYKSQKGQNPYFKHENECRPYKGPGTPQNNTCDLPQSGIQLMLVSGHTMVMDDSVDDPTGEPNWERSTKPFDFGCTDKFQGRVYIQSATGHMIEMSDMESDPCVRSEWNGIKLLTAYGNRIELNDHDDTQCVAGKNRGISMQTTSKHRFEMIDEGNEQCAPCRKNFGPENQNESAGGGAPGHGGQPAPLAKKAYIKIRSGYGLEIEMNDLNSQTETKQQFIQIYSPQYKNCHGPHIMRFQEVEGDQPGLVMLRTGGRYVVVTSEDMIEVVGETGGCSKPSNKVEIVSGIKLVYSKDYYINVTEKSHIFFAKDNILLLAGDEGEKESPEIGFVCMYDPATGTVKVSSKVIGSLKKSDPCVTMWTILRGKKKCHGAPV